MAPVPASRAATTWSHPSIGDAGLDGVGCGVGEAEGLGPVAGVALEGGDHRPPHGQAAEPRAVDPPEVALDLAATLAATRRARRWIRCAPARSTTGTGRCRAMAEPVWKTRRAEEATVGGAR